MSLSHLKIINFFLILTIYLSFCLVQGNENENRIIGGHEVDILKHPYLASVKSKIIDDGAYLHKCAGSVYTTKVVITAAQCITDISAHQRIMIAVGGNTRNDGLLYPAKKWLAHEKYNSWTIDYDIGMIFIEGAFDFNGPLVQPIQICTQRPWNGYFGIVAGWGYREEYGPSSYALEEIKVPIVSDEDCKQIYGANELTERMICAGYILYGGKDACSGDTGGPLIFQGQLVGLVSWGRGCARPGYPTVYTFVSPLQDWIEQKIKENQ